MDRTWKLETGTTRLPFVDMHAAGEPVRIVDATHVPLRGGTHMERREDLASRFDRFRRALMLEPRGHADMYGAILVAPTDPRAAAGVIFCHVSGYSTMCGHATIALGRYLHDLRSGAARLPTLLEAPCGLVALTYEPDDGPVGTTTFENVFSFASILGLRVELPDQGCVEVDVAFGGAYYAILPAARLGVDLQVTPLAEIATRLSDLVSRIRELDVVRHAAEPALGFLYGAILTEGDRLDPGAVNRHLCWFGEGQIDRSPTGSGVSARLALALARGEPVQDRDFAFAGRSGQIFGGRVINGDAQRVQTRVSGEAYYTSSGSFVVEPSDPFALGFDPVSPHSHVHKP